MASFRATDLVASQINFPELRTATPADFKRLICAYPNLVVDVKELLQFFAGLIRENQLETMTNFCDAVRRYIPPQLHQQLSQAAVNSEADKSSECSTALWLSIRLAKILLADQDIPASKLEPVLYRTCFYPCFPPTHLLAENADGFVASICQTTNPEAASSFKLFLRVSLPTMVSTPHDWNYVDLLTDANCRRISQSMLYAFGIDTSSIVDNLLPSTLTRLKKLFSRPTEPKFTLADSPLQYCATDRENRVLDSRNHRVSTALVQSIQHVFDPKNDTALKSRLPVNFQLNVRLAELKVPIEQRHKLFDVSAVRRQKLLEACKDISQLSRQQVDSALAEAVTTKEPTKAQHSTGR